MNSLGGAPRRGLAERIRYFAVWLLLSAISEWSWAILGMAFCLRKILASLGVIALVMMSPPPSYGSSRRCHGARRLWCGRPWAFNSPLIQLQPSFKRFYARSFPQPKESLRPAVPPRHRAMRQRLCAVSVIARAKTSSAYSRTAGDDDQCGRLNSWAGRRSATRLSPRFEDALDLFKERGPLLRRHVIHIVEGEIIASHGVSRHCAHKALHHSFRRVA